MRRFIVLAALVLTAIASAQAARPATSRAFSAASTGIVFVHPPRPECNGAPLPC